MSRRAWLLLGLVQAALIAGYLLVERARRPEAPFAWEPLDEPTPALAATRDGEPAPLPDGPHLVHFWATWCAPCVEELPSLLAAGEATGVPVVAVTDEPWHVVERWFGGEVPDGVVVDPDGAARWRVSGLPDTFVVRGDRVVARMGGPRDWRAREARRRLRAWGR